MTYREYLERAYECRTPVDADKLIAIVADDWSISDRQYENIRHVALESAYSL